MSKAEEVKLHIKVVINKHKKVLFAEAGSDFTDVLLSFLLLPLGKIVRVLDQHYGDKAPVIGSLSTLYSGLANLDGAHFLSEECKQEFLIPTSCYESKLCDKLRLNISCTKKTSSSCTKKTSSSTKESYRGVFTESAASFIISDDLRVMPNVENSIIESLSNLGIPLTDMESAELRNLTFGLNEIKALLKESLISLNPLTALVFPRSQMILAREGHASLHQLDPNVISKNSDKKSLRVMLQKSTNKLLFAQANYEFINFLFTVLTIPLGRVEYYFNGNTGLRTIDNLHKSIVEISSNNYVMAEFADAYLINPDFSDDKYCQLDEYTPLDFQSGQDCYRVTGSRMYMVSDDLSVVPLGVTSGISVIKEMNVSLSDVKEMELQVGLEEGLNILKAALTSTTALTDGLIKHKLKESLSSNPAPTPGDGIVKQMPKKRPKLES